MTTGRRQLILFAIILLCAGLLRLYLAWTRPYVWDENENWIPLAQTISFDSEAFNLPFRGRRHSALTAYVLWLSAALFGTHPLGWRALSLCAGLATIWMAYRTTRVSHSTAAALWVTVLIGLNEYHVDVSGRAATMAPFLLAVALAMYAFVQFTATNKAHYLYAAGATAALAFLIKERAIPLLPAFFIALWHPQLRRWLRSPHPYCAAGLFFLLIAPDIAWNSANASDEASVTYGDHLSRAELGFSPHVLMFFGRGAFQAVHTLITGSELFDYAHIYQTMNAGLGLLLLGAVAVSCRRSSSPARLFLVTFFALTLVPFLILRPSSVPNELSSSFLWLWADASLLPASVLAGWVLADAQGRWRITASACASAALLYALVNIFTWRDPGPNVPPPLAPGEVRGARAAAHRSDIGWAIEIPAA